jgi:signal transduction histidine kinase
MLDVSQIRHGRLSIRRGRCDLVALARRVVAETSAQSGEVPVSCATECAELVGDWDEFRLEQVVVNLLTNALRYGEGRPVEITLARAPRAAVIRVRDEGPGIAPEDQARIFEQFVRLGDGRRANGLGLGLYITRQLVQAHGGTIGVESRPGEGSTFTVTLPLS